MNLRQNTLLQIMLKEGSFQTIDSLAVLLNCSEKTLRNDIKDINTFLKDNNFETSIQTKQGSGVHLSLYKSEEAYLHFFLDTKILEIRPELERFYRGMIALLFSSQPFTMDSLAEELYSNRAQLKTDILRWESMLQTFHLTLEKKSHLMITGKEENIRLFVLYYFYQVAPTAMVQTIEPYFLEDHEEIFFIILHLYEQKLGQQFTNNAIHHFCIYLGIMIKRIRLHHSIQQTDKTIMIDNDIKKLMEDTFHIPFHQDELAFLDKVMESGAKQWNNAFIQNYTITNQTKHIADIFLKELQNTYHQPIDKTLYKPFCILLETALRRKEYDMRVLNYNSNQVKFDYLPVFLSVVKIFFDHKELHDLHLFETEYTRLAMLLIPYFKELNIANKLHVGLVVNCSIEQAYYGKYTIEKALPNIEIDQILTELDMEKMSNDEDFYISFNYLKTEKPYIQISGMLHSKDIEKIKSSISDFQNKNRKSLFSKKYEIKKISSITYDQLTQCLYDEMKKHSCFDMNLTQFCDQIHIIKLFQDDIAIIPFFHKDIKEDFLSIYDIEKDFYMEGVCIHHIHMLCIKERPYHELYDYVLYYKHHLKKDIIKP